MKLQTTLFGKTYQFRDLRDVMAKANEEKSGDKLAGIAAEDAQERVAAKAVLDLVIVLILTVSKGKGCIFSAIPVFLFQGAITLLAETLSRSNPRTRITG